eukprot:GHVR01028687.1.p1 GENE.GHVR01028687.1~~GHVR01028687.1.p1  ORF type:complete len:102 (-),score=20.72 GHVR01028687.1:26-331(-)
MPQKESIGCVFDIKKRSALIRIWGPHVDSAVVRITYNGCINNNDDESFDMVKIGNDIWECNVCYIYIYIYNVIIYFLYMLFIYIICTSIYIYTYIFIYIHI